MKRVYLIRHGLPDFPGGRGMCIGTTDIPMGKRAWPRRRKWPEGFLR